MLPCLCGCLLLQPHKLVAMHSLGMVFAMGVCLLAALGCVSATSLPHSTTLVAEFVTADFDWTDVPPGVKEDFAVENCTITGVKVCTVAVLCTPCGHVWRPPVAVFVPQRVWYYTVLPCAVQYYDGDYYLTVPRWRSGVPSTLNKLGTCARALGYWRVAQRVALPAVYIDGKPLLQPYPSWEMQTINNYSALQYVQSMEVDTQGRMWILDTGRVGCGGCACCTGSS